MTPHQGAQKSVTWPNPRSMRFGGTPADVVAQSTFAHYLVGTDRVMSAVMDALEARQASR